MRWRQASKSWAASNDEMHSKPRQPDRQRLHQRYGLNTWQAAGRRTLPSRETFLHVKKTDSTRYVYTHAHHSTVFFLKNIFVLNISKKEIQWWLNLELYFPFHYIFQDYWIIDHSLICLKGSSSNQIDFNKTRFLYAGDLYEIYNGNEPWITIEESLVTSHVSGVHCWSCLHASQLWGASSRSEVPVWIRPEHWSRGL